MNARWYTYSWKKTGFLFFRKKSIIYDRAKYILKIERNKGMPFQKIGKGFYARGSAIINYIEKGPQRECVQGELI